MTIDLPTESEPVRIIEGDCLEVLPRLPTGCVDAVVTDPPYGVSMLRGDSRIRERILGDEFPPDIRWIADYPAVVWGGNNFCDQLPRNTGWLVWDKFESDLSRHSMAELAWTNAVKTVRVHKQSFRGFTATASHDSDRDHPCQKPVKLMRWCIRLLRLPKNSVILDPYAGTGATAVAAIAEGMRCILIERDPQYVAIARKRVEAAMCKTGLFEGVA